MTGVGDPYLFLAISGKYDERLGPLPRLGASKQSGHTH